MLNALAPTAFVSRLLGREERAAVRPPVTHFLALSVPHRATRAMPEADGRMVVHCRHGSAWITHDGDPRDVVLYANQSYTVDRSARMTVHALQGDCGLELQVEVP